MMAELSIPNSAAWVADHYRDLLDGFVLDIVDEQLAPDIESMGIRVSTTNSVMVTLEDRIDLARHCLQLLESLRGA
jgi:LPPG:FO 2-phospho-L-lactate transferase